MKNEIKILTGLLILASVLISGCIETPIKPVCGNNIIEEGETSENCCIDVGCLEGQICENNICVLSGKYEGQTVPKEDTHVNEEEIGTGVGVADPASIYAVEMGCKHKLITNEKGQIGICILPDGTECEEWDFYRGKCGQEWSYCKQHGYDLKELGQNEGWFKGAVCLDKESNEIGTVYDLMGLGGERKNNSEVVTGGMIVGVADPASIYAVEMGCKHKLITNEKGQIGICILPDGTECEEWDFYRGKCGQEWSYCKQHGYDLKELGQNEGWFKGGICITREKHTTGTIKQELGPTEREVGTIYDLMNLSTKITCKR